MRHHLPCMGAKSPFKMIKLPTSTPGISLGLPEKQSEAVEAMSPNMARLCKSLFSVVINDVYGATNACFR